MGEGIRRQQVTEFIMGGWSGNPDQREQGSADRQAGEGDDTHCQGFSSRKLGKTPGNNLKPGRLRADVNLLGPKEPTARVSENDCRRHQNPGEYRDQPGRLEEMTSEVGWHGVALFLKLSLPATRDPGFSFADAGLILAPR
jgi:hypothetical protein